VNVEQPSPLPAGVSEFAVRNEYASGAEPELPLLLGMLLLGCAVVSWRRRTLAARSGA
jgi:hypothetical protein